MKGYFSINYDYYTEEVFFGNLNGELGPLAYIADATRDGSRVGMMIAHDVIEHAVAHRTKSYVTYEEEIRALGAIAFVRADEGFDMRSEVSNQVDMCYRDIKPVPLIIGKFLLKEGWINTRMMRDLIVKGNTPSDARNATYHYGWGEYKKTEQFEYSNDQARAAFDFIEQNSLAVMEAIQEEESKCSGASAYFDTVKHIFRWQFKRQV